MGETHGNATDPNEPKTPLWLTALGGVLFLAAGLAWALYTPDPPANADGNTEAAATADAGAAKK
ncbi:MAG: hypothetical protein KIT84_07560 [Labilithrix sp.]|nr:hypothetical protein [Labilithrix sp.]MCW5810852.1 hypothetical protein [Labilithrix sp.]